MAWQQNYLCLELKGIESTRLVLSSKARQLYSALSCKTCKLSSCHSLCEGAGNYIRVATYTMYTSPAYAHA